MWEGTTPGSEYQQVRIMGGPSWTCLSLSYLPQNTSCRFGMLNIVIWRRGFALKSAWKRILYQVKQVSFLQCFHTLIHALNSWEGSSVNTTMVSLSFSNFFSSGPFPLPHSHLILSISLSPVKNVHFCQSNPFPFGVAYPWPFKAFLCIWAMHITKTWQLLKSKGTHFLGRWDVQSLRRFCREVLQSSPCWPWCRMTLSPTGTDTVWKSATVHMWKCGLLL